MLFAVGERGMYWDLTEAAWVVRTDDLPSAEETDRDQQAFEEAAEPVESG